MHIIAAAIVLAVGCDTLEAPSLEKEVVVEAYLVAGEPLSQVRLAHTVPIDEGFDADSLGIADADVRIELLTKGGDVEAVYPYAALPQRPGVFVPDASVDNGSRPIARPLRSYRLVVHAAESDGPITSVTTVPDTFKVAKVNRDTVVYRSPERLTIYLSRPTYPGRQNVFILTTIALEPSAAELTPFAAAVFADGSATLATLTESVSPLLNEENFDRIGDGSLRVEYPWLGVNVYGRNRIVLQALDDNLYDFIRSQSVQQGGSTLPPGEIPNVLEHVDGARGLFGSVASSSVEFVVLRSAAAED